MVGQERKSWDSKHFFYRKVIVFRRETCCFTEIAHDNADFSVNFQSTALLSISEHLRLKNYTTGFLYSGQKKASSNLESGIFFSCTQGSEKIDVIGEIT